MADDEIRVPFVGGPQDGKVAVFSKGSKPPSVFGVGEEGQPTKGALPTYRLEGGRYLFNSPPPEPPG